MKKISIKKLIDNLNLDYEILAGENNLDNEIKSCGINRAGLELAGFFRELDDQTHRRAVLLSTKEQQYMSMFDKETRMKKYTDLINANPPLIIITKNFDDEVLVDIAKKLNKPLVKILYESTAQLIRRFLDVYDTFFCPTTEEHATLLNIFGKGVLIKGKSGIGKSEIALELVKNNHLFVGDDRIILTKKSNTIFGKSHPILKNLIEVRGIGIFDIAKASGYQIIMEESPVDLVIDLVPFKENGVDSTERLGFEWNETDILGVKVKHISIPVSAGRSITNIIQAAVGQFKINQSDQAENIDDLLEKRTMKFIEESED
ncbi:HPr(Ser) kinase/phosphatase [Mycoplasma sp. HU2014]|uniref:HPr(Ser) kinase/phosphatase n=1 Tax=Mycoplasma sp. HU2014 TaxID=1664275 RepID=UPI00067A8893|nr:HPr(Ser) kinase/phosphatase [Mycoplasma sp. HU2014]KNG79630.1 HPr serine kinase/phosphorylase [Mycoplasma sp. HU2014]